MKLTAPGKPHMETHYADLASKKFFPGLIEYMTSGPVCEFHVFSLDLLRSVLRDISVDTTSPSVGIYA